jgi:hypothetical protein
MGPKIKTHKLPAELSVRGMMIPNAGLIQISDSAMESRDKVVIIGGANEVTRKDSLPINSTLENILTDLSKKRKNLIVTTIPQRYDLNVTKEIRNEICLLNNFIRELMEIVNNYILRRRV